MIKLYILYALIILIAVTGLIRTIWFNTVKGGLGALVKETSAVVLFVAVTIGLYIPSSIYLANIEEFEVSFFKFLPIVMIPFVVLTLDGVLGLGILSKKPRRFLVGALFALTLCIYIQSNFLNFHMPLLDGSEFDFTDYPIDIIISAAVWIIIPVGVLLLGIKKKLWLERIMKYGSILLILMQLISLMGLAVIDSNLDKDDVVYTSEDMLSVGKRNILVLVVDSLDGRGLREYFEEYTDDADRYSDFTLFDECMGGGAPSCLGVPNLLSGSECDAVEDYDEYMKNAWADVSLYPDMRDEGYDVRFFVPGHHVKYMPVFYADNSYEAKDAYILTNYSRFGRKIFELALLHELPQIVKQFFITDTESFGECIDLDDGMGAFHTESDWFLQSMKNYGRIDMKYEQAFRYYHFYGVHEPYRQNEDLEYYYDATFNQVLRGNLKMISKYLDYLKELGVYDDSMIIICGDHGTYSGHPESALKTDPAVLIKRFGERADELRLNHSPITFRNVYATIAESFYEDGNSGATIYDISESSDQERLHTVTDDMIKFYAPVDGNYVRVKPATPNSTNVDAPKWDFREINPVSLEIGEELSIGREGGFDTRVYYDVAGFENRAVLSNEFTTYISLNGLKRDKGVSLQLRIDGVVGSKQRILASVNGHRIGSFDVFGEDTLSMDIPKEYLENENIYLRLVMPLAKTLKMFNSDSIDDRVLSVGLESIRVYVEE